MVRFKGFLTREIETDILIRKATIQKTLEFEKSSNLVKHVLRDT